jgi:hypothetical protein
MGKAELQALRIRRSARQNDALEVASTVPDAPKKAHTPYKIPKRAPLEGEFKITKPAKPKKKESKEPKNDQKEFQYQTINFVLAKSNRAKCKNSKCSQEIPKGQIKFCSYYEYNGYVGVNSYHLGCISKSQKEQIDEFGLDEVDGYDLLYDKDIKIIKSR